jgi:uncharacterized protein (DUF1501 family)
MSLVRFSRRALLGALGVTGFDWMRPRLAFGQDANPARKVFVCVFLRGAADGLNMIVPHADDDYYRLRPSIAVPRPGEARGAIDLDGRFGLHPRLAPLKAAFDAKELAVIHAVGSPHPTRSHFEAQDYMQTAAVGVPTAARGWVASYLAMQSVAEIAPLRAVALSSRAPMALRGYRDALVAESLHDLRLAPSDGLEQALSEGFAQLYATDGGRPAERAGKRALEAGRIVKRVLGKRRRPSGYPRDAGEFAEVAKLIKADVGLEVAWLDIFGWDTHRQQGSTEYGDLPRRLDHLAGALAAFRADLAERLEDVLVLVMSEFGRTARENGTGGTDHGHGNVMLLLGGSVQGGRVLGNFPGLQEEHLFERRDVPVTTDFRDVLAEICERHLRVADASALFPSYALDRARRLGLFI